MKVNFLNNINNYYPKSYAKADFKVNFKSARLPLPLKTTKPIKPANPKLAANKDVFNYSNKHFSHVKVFGVNDYLKLDKNQKAQIDDLVKDDEDIFDDCDINTLIAPKLKDYLDKKYNEDGYVFISIGTSPSSIARVLEFMGVEVKYLPVSGLKNFDIYSDVEIEAGAKGTKEYKKFLDKQKINDRHIKKSKKKYLFIDYTDSGKSLKIYQDLIRNVFKINSDNVEFLSLNKIIGDLSDGSEDFDKLVRYYIYNYLVKNGSSHICAIKHLTPKEFQYINKQILRKISQQTQMYNYCVMKILDKNNLLKYNPKNKNSL